MKIKITKQQNVYLLRIKSNGAQTWDGDKWVVLPDYDRTEAFNSLKEVTRYLARISTYLEQGVCDEQ